MTQSSFKHELGVIQIILYLILNETISCKTVALKTINFYVPFSLHISQASVPVPFVERRKRYRVGSLATAVKGVGGTTSGLLPIPLVSQFAEGEA